MCLTSAVSTTDIWIIRSIPIDDMQILPLFRVYPHITCFIISFFREVCMSRGIRIVVITRPYSSKLFF